MSANNPHSFKLPSPMLIMVMGLPGSGKSYFARAFARKIGGIHFNSDIIRKQEPACRTGRQEHTAYTAKNKSQVYQTMFQQVCQALEQRQIVVVDATFSLQQYRSPYIDFAKVNGIRLCLIMIMADEKTIYQRLQHSRPDSDADFEVYKKIKAEYEPVDMEYLQLNSTQHSLDALMEQGLSYLNASAP